jgi:hypothetical protein
VGVCRLRGARAGLVVQYHPKGETRGFDAVGGECGRFYGCEGKRGEFESLEVVCEAGVLLELELQCVRFARLGGEYILVPGGFIVAELVAFNSNSSYLAGNFSHPRRMLHNSYFGANAHISKYWYRVEF